MNTPFQAVALHLDTLLTPECRYDFKARLFREAGPYLRSQRSSPWLPPWLAQLQALQGEDRQRGRMSASPLPSGLGPDQLEVALGYITELLREEREETVIAQLAGRLLEHQAREGQLVASLFDDVPRMTERWKKRKVPSALLSTWPAPTLRALLECSDRGNLGDAFTQLCSAPNPQALHDDAYYHEVAQILGVSSDRLRVGVCAVEEAYAASNAGCQVVFFEREGVMNPPSHRFRVEVTLLAL